MLPKDAIFLCTGAPKLFLFLNMKTSFAQLWVDIYLTLNGRVRLPKDCLPLLKQVSPVWLRGLNQLFVGQQPLRYNLMQS